ncbi:hypothetical protein BCV69DRAFT_285351 [Microstroma glucosiphilum]|uniref:Uncharacterized protein n=1 Tax=Pseudomicrostroma glucosiphilum TaxID=1684307 RepID=A0A316TXB0_9BASI|nr:hypothetical protein BCV69DRAFT_285351 [Pseudomicrostroma glucosiphilum]PWN18056.1 hypothetical protein BCV69DRAFT_285351 [Pseudomicrostroma glucosiphilum]
MLRTGLAANLASLPLPLSLCASDPLSPSTRPSHKIPLTSASQKGLLPTNKRGLGGRERDSAALQLRWYAQGILRIAVAPNWMSPMRQAEKDLCQLEMQRWTGGRADRGPPGSNARGLK